MTLQPNPNLAHSRYAELNTAGDLPFSGDRPKAFEMGSISFGTNQRALDYFLDVIGQSKRSSAFPDIDVIVVAHAYYTALPLVQALEAIGRVRGVILKNSTNQRFPEVGHFLRKQGVPVQSWDKSLVKKGGEAFLSEFDEILRPQKPFVIVDHGGYFAYSGARKLFAHYDSERFLGATEYTANGHHRYQRIEHPDRPVISVGRSELKITSDTSSARLVVQAAFDCFMQHNLYLYDERNSIGVIGHGRMGSAMTKAMAGAGFRHLYVNDADHMASVRLEGLPYLEKEELCSDCNVIFCATGHRAIDPEHYALLKDGTFIFTATSPDDELHLDELIKKNIIQLNRAEGDIYEYIVSATGNRIYLPFNGEAANIFYPSGVTDPTIYYPQAAQLAATVELVQNSASLKHGVTVPKKEIEKLVADLGRKHFMRPSSFSQGACARPDQIRAAQGHRNAPAG